ncbi:kelch repeat-containing protein [Geobacter sp. AOG2]|uniref:kelch repeat-containing protein n=1 Tax=Geobacter sp. AOG2 TaxID=1566347 RepID=UPI001CC48EB8|nr:kelch repeat-containing protein [Geobacter sp. AOG2]GFE62824.1 hypothetical protein AOG2_34130 [Geobacter sp. AOG2]
MNSARAFVSTLLTGTVIALWLVFSPLPVMAAPLASQFFATDPTAAQIMTGITYDMNDPNWIVATKENRNIFAFKVFSGLFMLGYQTEMGYNYGLNDQQVRAITAFQARNGLPVTSVVDSTCLSMIDQQLVSREQALAVTGQGFLLYNHMQQLLANDVSKDTLATIYSLPMAVLPHYLRMSGYETVQCIVGQCVGTIKDAQGVDLSIYATPVDVTSDYRFVGAYFDPAVSSTRFPSAAVDADTVLHEYAHYLDGHLYRNINRAGQPLFGVLDTTGFSDISYDMAACANGCCPRRSSDPMEWISKYGFTAGVGTCPAGSSYAEEEWAEAFSMYVAAGRDFRSAAQANATIARKYDWLKDNVFMGLEYDTDLPRGMESGCNDVYGTAAALPGYAKCDDAYLWDFTLPLVAASVDTTPAAFSFAAETGVEISTVTVSAGATVNGINWGAPVTVAGGEYAINGGAYGSAPGVVHNNDTVVVRQTSSASYGIQTDAVLTIGGVSATFSVTTRIPAQPTISGSPATAVMTSVPYSFTPASANAVSFTISGTLPAGLTFDPATGSLSGTLGVAGSYGPLVISALNGNLSAALPGFTITATAPVGSFAATGSLNTGREEHTATLLSNGKVLVAGGYDWLNTSTATVELYDPATATWSPAAAMTSPRAGHTATLLHDGTVLVTGGYDDNYATLESSELYDPITDTWSAVGAMASSRSGHTAILLPSGAVLAAGGMVGGMSIAGAELYDPASKTWQATPPMATARSYHSAVLLNNGKVLVAGGYDADVAIIPSAELYDPAANTWSQASAMHQARANHAANLLPDGTVLACGGFDENYATSATAERYDPVADRWNAAAPMSSQRAFHTSTLLSRGLVLAAGGQGASGSLATAEVYDPAGNAWIASGPLAVAQMYHSATLLTNGLVLLAGGNSEVASAVTDAQVYDNGQTPDYAVIFVSGGNGSVTGVAAQRIARGGSATTVVAVPVTGYRFVDWTGTNGFAPSTANPLSVAAVTAGMTVTANFLPLPDGVVVSGGATPNVGDVLAVLRHVTGLASLTPAQKAHADVAPLGPDGMPLGNGVVDLGDVLVLLRRAAGLASW